MRGGTSPHGAGLDQVPGASAPMRSIHCTVYIVVCCTLYPRPGDESSPTTSSNRAEGRGTADAGMEAGRAAMAADAAAMSITCKARRIFDCHRIHGTLHRRPEYHARPSGALQCPPVVRTALIALDAFSQVAFRTAGRKLASAYPRHQGMPHTLDALCTVRYTHALCIMHCTLAQAPRETKAASGAVAGGSPVADVWTRSWMAEEAPTTERRSPHAVRPPSQSTLTTRFPQARVGVHRALRGAAQADRRERHPGDARTAAATTGPRGPRGTLCHSSSSPGGPGSMRAR